MRSLCLGLLAAGLVACGRPEPTADLAVCLGEADPPRSVAGLGGFDVDVAALLARALDRKLVIVWQPEPIMNEIESTDIDFGPLLTGQCDLMLSVPGADAIVGLEAALSLSQPYYGTGFELIPEHGALTEDSTVAVRANTVAHVVIDARGHRWTMQPDSAAIAAAVASGRADVGLIWGPELAVLEVAHNDDYEPPRILRWNQHAATRRDDPLVDELNAILTGSGAAILELLDEHGIPVHPPYAAIHQQDALRAL